MRTRLRSAWPDDSAITGCGDQARGIGRSSPGALALSSLVRRYLGRMAQVRFVPALRFRSLTPLFDGFVSLLGYGDSFLDRVTELLAVQDRESVLDLGCGTGRLLPRLAELRTVAVTGVDIDDESLAIAARKTEGRPNVELLQASATALPLEDARMDAVVSVLAFHHLEPQAKRVALQEVRRVLRPDGRMLLVDFGRPETSLQKLLLGIGSWADGRRNVLPHIKGEVPDLLRGAGFSVREVAPSYRAVRFLECRPRRDEGAGERSP